MGKKYFLLAILILMAITIPFIIFICSFNSVSFNERFYIKEFSKHDVYENLKDHDIEKINNDVLDYLKNEKNNDLIDTDFFNEREKLHLLDVKNLIRKTFLVYYTSLILFLLSLALLVFLMEFKIKKIAERGLIIVLAGSSLALLVGISFFVLSNFNFNFVFNAFHKTFFSSGTYTFNPLFEKIVVLYPPSLFFDALTRIVSGAIITSIMLLLCCTAPLFFLKTKFFHKFLKKIPTEKPANRKF
ncbi:DUF1461 domain-containing protein [Candidatus Woesearchaeota archaeon]|nr:DUF1461 domain-containing protein [Candidatus Woesearchaeota archaeon]